MEKILKFWTWLTSIERVPFLAENWGWVVFLTGLGIWLTVRWLFFEDLGRNKNYIYRIPDSEVQTGGRSCATCVHGGGGFCSAHSRQIYEPERHRCPQYNTSFKGFEADMKSLGRDTSRLLDWILAGGVQTVAVTLLLLGLCALNTYICLNQDILDALADFVWRVTVTALVVVTLNANMVLHPNRCYEALRGKSWPIRLGMAAVAGWMLAGLLTLIMLASHVAGTVAYVVLALGWKVVSFLVSAFIQIVS